MLWKKSYFLGFVLNERKHFMMVKMTSINQNYEWYIVNMYAPNIKNSREKVWNTLSNIKRKYHYGRWIFMGDFNVPLYDHEKKGGNVS